MTGKQVRIVGRTTWEGHHGEVLGLVPQTGVILHMLYRVKLKNGVTIRCYPKYMVEVE